MNVSAHRAFSLLKELAFEFIKVVDCVCCVCLFVPVPKHIFHRSRAITRNSIWGKSTVSSEENVVAVFHKLE